MALSPMLISQVLADPAAVLKVSLPEGTYVNYNNDPWLSECWLLNLTGASQTFILRINDTSESIRSYDTHLIIALNDEGYNNLETLIVNGTQVPKSALRYGTPTPYNIWTWPSGDVYPTWFNDTLVNVGTIEKKGYVDLTVSITVSNATNVRIHFDAYGSKVKSPPPTKVGDITRNGISEDSTVLLQPGAPPPLLPIAGFYYTPQYPETNETVTFNATESYDPDGYIVSYTWDFGDGTPKLTTNDPVTNHTYTAFGDFTVTLTVTDNSGLIGEASSPIHVSQHPVASFTFTPTEPLAHETVTFDASASTPDGGTIVNYTWNFGDENTTTVSEPIITHAYSTYGTYTVTLNITDSEGKWDTTSKQITVAGLPIADFWWTPYYPQRYENVTFDASTSTPDGGTIISYAWNFGDGTPIIVETGPITTHYYTAVGNYTVTLNVTDSEGRWDTETKTITVVPIRYYLEVKTDPTGVTTIPGQGWYDENTNINLTAPDTVSISTGTRYKFTHWTVDDASQGEGVNQITVLMDKNHTAIAHYKIQYYLTVKTDPYGITTIPGEGWYDNSTSVSLNAPTVTNYQFNYWNIDGVSQGSGVNPITVSMNAPHNATAHYTQIAPLSASISPTTAKIKVGESVSFTSTVSGGQPPYQYQWYLNGTAASGATSSSWTFTPTTSGYYIVTLKVTDSLSNIANSNEATVTVAPPLTVSISPTSASILVGQSITFTSTTSGGYPPYTYQWYLNGAPASGATSSSWTFTPTSSGIYYIQLKVTDSNGNTVQSETARVTVATVPVGGYSVSLAKNAPITPTIAYTLLIVSFSCLLSITKHKRK